VVLGFVDPQHLLTKGGARPGDQLVLTKPLGTGVITTAFMRDLTTDDQMAAATASMLRLNRAASAAALAAGVRAATDITGFGLLGHAAEMLQHPDPSPATPPSGFRLFFDRLPWLPGAQQFGNDWVYPGGAHNNRQHFGPSARFDPRLTEAQQTLCFSPETSGGLLMAVPPHQLDALLRQLEPAWVVGEVVPMDTPAIEVV
jgi:selenide,water dikinase